MSISVFSCVFAIPPCVEHFLLTILFLCFRLDPHQSLFGGIERDSYGFTVKPVRGADADDFDDDADGGSAQSASAASSSHSAAPEVNWELQRRLWNSYLALHPRVSKDDSELKVGGFAVLSNSGGNFALVIFQNIFLSSIYLSFSLNLSLCLYVTVSLSLFFVDLALAGAGAQRHSARTARLHLADSRRL